MDDVDLDMDDMLDEAGGGDNGTLIIEDVTAAIAAIGGLPLNETSVSGRRNILDGVYLIPSALPVVRWERKRRAGTHQRQRRRRLPSFRPGSARAAASALTRRSIRWLVRRRLVVEINYAGAQAWASVRESKAVPWAPGAVSRWTSQRRRGRGRRRRRRPRDDGHYGNPSVGAAPSRTTHGRRRIDALKEKPARGPSVIFRRRVRRVTFPFGLGLRD